MNETEEPKRKELKMNNQDKKEEEDKRCTSRESNPGQGTILPLDHWCFFLYPVLSELNTNKYTEQNNVNLMQNKLTLSSVL
jgi:hypothetical protein